MRIGQKIGLGFGIVMLLAIALGTMAVVAMRSASRNAAELSAQQIPALLVSTEIERNALQTMFAIRGYTLSNDPQMLQDGRDSLTTTEKHIADATRLAGERKMAALGQAAVEAQGKTQAYRRLLEETQAEMGRIDALVAERGAAAEELMKQAHAYLAGQDAALREEIAAGAAPERIAERFGKTVSMNTVIDLGGNIRIAVWRTQAENDGRHAQAALPDFDRVAQILKDLRTITRQQSNLDQLGIIAAASERYRACVEKQLDGMKALRALAAQRLAASTDVLTVAKAAAEANIAATVGAVKHTDESLSQASAVLLAGLALVALLGIGASVLIARDIIRALTRIVEDLSACADQTASASEQVASGAQALANGTSETAAALEETSASLEEMNSLVRQSSQSSEAANSVASQARAAGERGAQAMDELAQAIAEIKANADQTAKIVKTIDEIAFQTNLLALNAAVEAARAGDAGKGFAVVAEEVRNLAQRAGEAARSTSQLIEQSVRSAENGVSLSRNVTQVVTEMTGASRKVNDLAGEVAASSREIAQGIDQVSRAVRQMDQVTQGNAAGAEENSAVGEEMSAQAQSLAQLVGQLEGMIRAAAAGPATRPAAPRAPAPPQAKPAAHAAPRPPAPPLRPARAAKPAAAAPPDDEARTAIPFDDDRANQQTLAKF